MRENTPERGALRRMTRRLRRGLSYLGTGLMYLGAASWPNPEVLAALRAEAAKLSTRPARHEPERAPGRPPHPERITSHKHLPYRERRLFLKLEEQFRQEKEK
ncbi:hypothetical protein Aros01_07840 [Streptosporangium roseum]|uniref:Uncharacterized protein n=2 Tax=Streptosporangium roseum TaxID=2001 RepID=D2AWP7_STRRD|nr:hypothetical protein Sros_4139 [Streptosporangium roseum DSM 43021]